MLHGGEEGVVGVGGERGEEGVGGVGSEGGARVNTTAFYVGYWLAAFCLGF